MTSNRIYLDHAATSWPKSSAAVDAAIEYTRHCGASVGRGGYASAVEGSRWLADARFQLAKLIGAGSGDSLAMCHSGTHALNVALQGLLRTGDHVITTDMEHNSALRPLAALEQAGRISVSYVPCDGCGQADIVAARRLLQPNTRLFAVGHASNVTGAVTDLVGWSELAREAEGILLVDASQTLGYLPIDVDSQHIDVLAAAGHKGLRALAGTGLLYLAPHLQPRLAPIMWGGTGVASEQLDGGMEWPHSVEVGNLNVPAVISMAVTAREKLANDQLNAWQAVFERLIDGLTAIPSVQLIGYPDLSNKSRVPLVSLRMAGWDVHDLASVLDGQFGIEVRSGFHCAARIHTTLGTSEGGTLRLSTGHSTTCEDIAQTLAAFQAIGDLSASFTEA